MIIYSIYSFQSWSHKLAEYKNKNKSKQKAQCILVSAGILIIFGHFGYNLFLRNSHKTLNMNIKL